MSDLHIDDFCKDSAKILVALYARFPQKSILYVDDISGPDQPDEFGLHSPRHLACLSTMLWLAETDYILFNQTIRQEAIDEATLTHRGFTFLATNDSAAIGNSIANTNRADTNQDEIEENLKITPSDPLLETRIEQIRRELREGSSNSLRVLMLRYFKTSRSFC